MDTRAITASNGKSVGIPRSTSRRLRFLITPRRCGNIWLKRASASELEMEKEGVFSMQPIGFVRSPYHNTRDIPKGCGATHEAEGVLEIRPDLEPGLAD